MSYRGREIESKLIVYGRSLNDVNNILNTLFEGQKTKQVFGSSVDTYWTVRDPEADADFVRMRERDGIRQITVKGKDKGTNLDRIEIDIDSTSEVSKITRLLNAVLGAPAGRVGKTYYVYWTGRSEHTTVCCYSVNLPGTDREYPHVIVEVETTTMDNLLNMESTVITGFRELGIEIERAPGSLYEMFISKGEGA